MGTYRIKVKEGDYGYRNGVHGVHDYVADYDNFMEAVKDFIEWVDGSTEGDEKVTLTFRPSKGDKA